MTTKILGNQITSYTIDTVQLSNTATAAFAKTLAPKVLYANVASNTFTVLDDTAVNVGGGYIVVTGAEFQSGATVLIDTVPASAVTYVNSTTLQVQVPTKSAASYNLYVVNPDGGVGIKVAGITYSSEPSWTTASPLANQAANTAFGVNLSATSATSYSLAAGSTLPAGTTLAANGYFSGTVTIGAQTTYTFSIVATDDELQDSSKTFQVTVTVIPPMYLFSWGKNVVGALGLNDTVLRSSPTQVGSGTTWLKVTTGNGNYSSAAIKTDGTLWIWGQNVNANLGLNDVINRSSPTQLGTLSDWSEIECGGYNFAGIRNNGTLWTWGWNNDGELGLNNTDRMSSPVQVGTATNWSKVSIGNTGGTVGIKTDGTLWTWGTGFSGVLGTNTTINRSSPVQVGTDTDWTIAKKGYAHIVAIKTNGTLWSWGWNNYGQLGINTNLINQSSPVQVGTATNWSSAAVYNNATMVTKTDGTLWLWGYNNYGQLGLNDAIDRSSPVQVGSATNWSNKLSMGNFVTGAIKTDGTLWTWGNGQQFSGGSLGLNDGSIRSSPTQVGAATTWLDLNVAYRGLAIRS